MARISMWMGEGCLMSSVAALMDAFAVANLWNTTVDPDAQTPLFKTEVVTLTGNSIETYGGMGITPHCSINDVDQSDGIIVATHFPHVRPVPEGLNLLQGWIEELRASGAKIGTVCTGSFLLAEMGLQDNKIATTNWHFANLFRKRYPKVKLRPGMMMTQDDGIICTGATTAVYNLALHLIEWFGSKELATVCAKALLIDPNRTSQAPYMMLDPQKNHGDDKILQAQEIIEKKYPQVGSIDQIAKDVGVSPRQFKRRF